MKRSVISGLAILLAAGGAQASTLRVACDGPATGAEVFVAEKFKGECPIDIQVKGGTIKLKATKNIAGKTEIFEQSIRIGDDVTKRIEVLFENVPVAPMAVPVQVDPKVIAQQRYEAEMVEYEKSIKACLPKYTVEKRKLEQELREATRAHSDACYEYWEERSPSCGWWDANSRLLLDRKTEARDDLERFTRNSPEDWCKAQFTAPKQP